MGKDNDKKTPEQLFEEAKGKFKGNYGKLLSMIDSDKLHEIIEQIKDYVETYAEGVSTSQLRNIYSKVKPLKGDKGIKQLQLQRPKLAYIIARQDNRNRDNAIAMMSVMEDLMKDVREESQLKNFQYFMESVVAYHKFYDKVG